MKKDLEKSRIEDWKSKKAGWIWDMVTGPLPRVWGTKQACEMEMTLGPIQTRVSYFNSYETNYEFCGDRKFPF